MPIMLDADIETILLEDLDLDITPQCDNEFCDNEATHIIRCVCQKGAEFSCFTCVLLFKQAVNEIPEKAIIFFDPEKSCGHITPFALCSVSPL
jgi:hypothetical protein